MREWDQAEATVITSFLTPEALARLWIRDRLECNVSQSMVLYYMDLNHSGHLLKCRFQGYTQDPMSWNLWGEMLKNLHFNKHPR